MLDLPPCSCGTRNEFMKFLQDRQVLQFLMDLDDVYKTTRGNILMMQPLPNLNQAYRLMLQEETQRDCQTVSSMTTESTAFASYQNMQNNRNFNSQSFVPQGKQNQQNVVFGITPSGKK